MNDVPDPDTGTPLAPFADPTFRAIWIASLVSNFGGLIQAVGAAWMMTAISTSADMVALVQASTTLPIMLFSLVGGRDRRQFQPAQGDADRAGLHARASRSCWRCCAYLGLMTPWLLLAFTFLIGCGTALNNPAWQASVGDMVPRARPAGGGGAEQRRLQHHPQRRPGDRRRRSSRRPARPRPSRSMR